MVKVLGLAVVLMCVGCVGVQAQAASAGERKFRLKRAHEVGTLCDRKIDIQYPYLVGGARKQKIKVNRAIHGCVDRQIGPFWPGTQDATYECRYQVEKFNQKELKVLFTFQLPMGGAHGGVERKVAFYADIAAKPARTSAKQLSERPW
jgi:hypothetical protein